MNKAVDKDKEIDQATLLEQIKAYAKELYMTQGKSGAHKYTNPTILEKIKKRFGKEYKNRSIVTKWAKSLDENGSSWDKEYHLAIAVGVSGADIKKAEKDGMIPSEIIENKIVEKTRKVQEKNEKLNHASSDVLLTWVASKHSRIKELIAKYRIPSAIPEEEWNLVLSDEDKKILLAIKKDSDAVLKDLRDNAGIVEKRSIDILIDKLSLLSVDQLALAITNKDMIPISSIEELERT